MKILGFDLGDGESAVALFDEDSTIEPRILPVQGRMSILSAVGDRDGQIVIGEEANVLAGADNALVRFKAKFLTDPSAAASIRRFAQGMMAQLLKRDPAIMASVSRTVVGCPAGWGEGRRQQYAALMESAGFPNVHVVPEPRAAFLYVRHARGLRVDAGVMRRSALVVDVGSSTTDFAYIVDGKQQNLSIFGDTNLGGGVLDELILEHALKTSPDGREIRRVFEACPAWRSYCELEARRIKEAYFLDEQKWANTPLVRQTTICYDETLMLDLRLDAGVVGEIIRTPCAALGGRSFTACLNDALTASVRVSADCPPQGVILTGGASRMTFLREAVKRAFPRSMIIICPEPECSIARGLAYAGSVDEKLLVFRREIASIAHGDRLTQAVGEAVHRLYEPIAAAVFDTVQDCALQATRLWRKGTIRTIEEMETLLSASVQEALASDALSERLREPLGQWLDALMHSLEIDLVALCERCGVPPEKMSLRGAKIDAGVSEVDFSVVDALGMDVFSNLLGVVMATAGAVLCGGGGVALVASGPIGMTIGAVLGILLVLLGKKSMDQAVRRMHIPMLMRMTVTDHAVISGMARQRRKIENEIVRALGDVRGGFITRLCVSLSKTLGAQMETMAANAEMSIEA